MKINMTKLAKSVGGDQWLSYMDTYNEIPKEEIIEQDERGFDLIQRVNDDNQHMGFSWEPKNQIYGS